jgi:hypothetical protein
MGMALSPGLLVLGLRNFNNTNIRENEHFNKKAFIEISRVCKKSKI